MSRIEAIVHTISTAIQAFLDGSQWSTMAVPFPATHGSQLGGFVIAILVGLFLLSMRFYYSNRRSVRYRVTVEIMQDSETTPQAEIKSTDARQFRNVFGVVRSGQDYNVNFFLRDVRGQIKHSRCLMRVNQGSSIAEKHLRIASSLAQAMKLSKTNAGDGFETDIDIRAPSWWSSTFGNPDPSIRTQWVTGSVLGFVFTLPSLVLALLS